MGAKKTPSIYHLKVTLIGSKPPVWRRIIVPHNIGLPARRVWGDMGRWWRLTTIQPISNTKTEYVGKDFDSEYLSLDEVNARLGRQCFR